jgi:Bacteriophage probable baseplate hub protein
MPTITAAIPSVADYDITINGAPLSIRHKTHLAALSVDVDTRWPCMFEFALVGSQYLKNDTEWIDDMTTFAMGNEVECKMGYVNDLGTVMVGEITGLEPEFTVRAMPRLIVRGYDRGHRLLRGRKTRTFSQQKDSDIASAIAGEAGLTADVTDSQVTHDYVCQAHQTDMEFLKERAKRINYEVVVDGKRLVFRPVQNAESEIMTLTMEGGLLEFFPRLSTMRQLTETKVLGWDLKDKKEILGLSKTGDEDSTMGGDNGGGAMVQGPFGEATASMGDRPVATQAEADQIAKAHLNSAALELISGEGVCRGRYDLLAGKVIKIDGVGKRFSGQYYIIAASHRYRADRAYQTHFVVRRSGS